MDKEEVKAGRQRADALRDTASGVDDGRIAPVFRE